MLLYYHTEIFWKLHSIFSGITVCFQIVTRWLTWCKPIVPLESKRAPVCLVVHWLSQNPRQCLLFFFPPLCFSPRLCCFSRSGRVYCVPLFSLAHQVPCQALSGCLVLAGWNKSERNRGFQSGFGGLLNCALPCLSHLEGGFQTKDVYLLISSLADIKILMTQHLLAQQTSPCSLFSDSLWHWNQRD